MSQPRTFTAADLSKVLGQAGSRLGRKIAAYLIGGCAMTFMGKKIATKDIDIVFGSAADARDFASAIQLVGFRYVLRPSIGYNALGASAIMEDSRGMRFDIFDRQVCRALEISEAMKARAPLYQSFDHLDVHLMAPEDIFLFKGITERAADLADMRVLAEVRLNWQTIEQECLSQKRSGQWAYMLGTKLLELRAKFGIESPIIENLMDHADLDLLTYVFGNIIGEGNSTFKKIAQAVSERYRYSASWTRKQLTLLVRRRIVGRKKVATRRYIYYMRKSASS
ncbi:MAG: hypothetical protein WCC94_08685 [Candidatus Bathyarchaeia archaeon]